MSGAVRWSVQRALELPATPDAVPTARALLREVLRGPLEPRLADGELALSALVTNAVLHGRDPVAVRVVLGGGVLRAPRPTSRPSCVS